MATSKKNSLPASYRWSVFSRVAAAAVAGYAATSAATILLAFALPQPREDALLTANMLSFAIYTGFILWAFTARNATRVWIGLLGCTAALAAAAVLARTLQEASA